MMKLFISDAKINVKLFEQESNQQANKEDDTKIKKTC